MKFENTEVWGFEHAIRGMRNPLESHEKNDFRTCEECQPEQCGTVCTMCMFWEGGFYFGENNLTLAKKLIKAGAEHRKFLRQIFVSVDITAPLYFMSELDTYKIGVTRNSTSMQHKGVAHGYTESDFELDTEGFMYIGFILPILNKLRNQYLETKDYKYFRAIRQLMPMSYLYRSTITMNYENVLNMYQQRCEHPHKLTEWSVDFKNWAESLPYFRELFLEK